MTLRFWGRGLAMAAIALLLLGLAGWAYWLGFDLERVAPANPRATPADLAFVAARKAPRGRLLAVVSSAATVGSTRKRGGYEHTELARAYYVFVANGYEVDIASPRGGRAPAVIDEDLTDADHAFLNDPVARGKVERTLRLADVDPARYAGVYFVGGKGAMADFPDNPDIARVLHGIDARGGVIGAVCHGPAALLGIRRADGIALVAGRRLTGFSNAEELFLIEDARTVFPWLLQDRLREAGAEFVEGPMYLDNTVVDGRLITGQNPWSTWSVAEAMVRVLGHEPVPRAATAEEQAVRVLARYRSDGADAARALYRQLPGAEPRLLLLHALIAGMRGEWREAFQLQRLARG